MQYLFRLVVEQPHQQLNGLEVLEAAHVLLADGALPDGAGSRRQQLFVVRLLQKPHQWVQAAIVTHQVTCLLLLGTLPVQQKV